MKRSIFLVLLILFSFCEEMQAQLQREATLLQHRDRIRVTPLPALNSSFRETNMSITPDGRYLFFMSLRGGQYWSRQYMVWGEDSVFDGDIWYTQKVNGSWAKAKCLPYGINTSNGEDEPNVSPNGRKVYYQSWQAYWQFTGGPYYEAELVNGKWGEGKGLGGGITEFFKSNFDATDGMTISPDGKTFIVACGNDYHNNMDLYISRKGPRGWSYCKRLGVSTPLDERSAFIAADGQTLYFASNGYGGYGGLDIFKTTIKPDGSCGEVINLGKPFNTSGDDYGFILTGDGKEGYFIRNGDIYFADLTNADPRMKPAYQISLKGVVKDSLTGRPMQAKIILMDARTTNVVKILSTDSKGRYQALLPNKNATYYQSVKSKGYKTKKDVLKTREALAQQSYESNFYLAKPQPTPPPVVAQNDPPPRRQDRPDPVVKENPPEPVKPPKRDFGLNKVETQPKTKIDVGEDPASNIEAPKYEDPYSFTNVAENNLILLLDISASMKQADKLPMLKESIKNLITYMRAVDRISIVTYSSDARVLLDGVSAAEQAAINKAINNLGGGGGTNSKVALKKAFKIAGDNYIEGGNNRIILATDGYFDLTELNKIVEKGCNQNQVQLSIFSFGKLGREQEGKFERLAELGSGNHSNINSNNVNDALLKEAKAVRKK
jgi:Tol biopolymer transport system component